MLKPTISVVLDTRVANKKKLYPIKLRATFQIIQKGKKKWVQKYYALKRAVSKKDFKAIREGSVRSEELREIRVHITDVDHFSQYYDELAKLSAFLSMT